MSAAGQTIFETAKDGSLHPPLAIRKVIGKPGGSGTVWEHPGDPAKAIKIYHAKERSKFEEKARTMIKVKYNRPHADRFDFAWPEALVVDSSGSFLGFKMPLLGRGWIDLESLMQAREAEDKHGLGDRERLLIAANLAMAVKELHLLGTYCIDLKPDNIRVSLRNWAVCIIDCDGMSVIDIASPTGKRFHADKSTPEFWAPENIGVKPDNFEDQEAHDRFALATIIFMLLNRGIHPFQGVMSFDIAGSETTAGKIKNNLYPYGAGKGRITPHQDSLYPFWPKEMKGLFDRAFATTTARPSAEEWLGYLSGLFEQADVCDRNRKFHVGYPEVGCAVCARDQALARQRRVVSAMTASAGFSAALVASPSLSGGLRSGLSPMQPAQAPSAGSVHSVTTIQAPAGFVRRAAPAIGIGAFLIVAALVTQRSGSGTAPTGVTVVSETSSSARSPPPAVAPPPRCAQQRVFAQAVQGGAPTLRNYIGECVLVTGAFVPQARDALEPLVYNEALWCIRSSCSFDSCLARYTQDFAFGSKLASLRNEVQQAKASPRCRPPASFEAGEAALQSAGNNAGSQQSVLLAQSALQIYSALPNSNSPLVKDRIARAHGVIGVRDNSDRSNACNHLNIARRLFVELGNAVEIRRTDVALQVQSCIASAPAAPRPPILVPRDIARRPTSWDAGAYR
jgi:eukaryotic-like serine/threonine-protein kinase